MMGAHKEPRDYTKRRKLLGSEGVSEHPDTPYPGAPGLLAVVS